MQPFLPLDRSRKSILGFSLVEVVIAIGLVSFTLIAIVGLFSIGLNRSRESADETNLALMTRQSLSWCRAYPFASYPKPTPALPKQWVDTLYFDEMGGAIPHIKNDPTPVNAYYSCTIMATYTGTSDLFIPLQLTFEWPLKVSSTSPLRQTRVVLTSRANED